MEGGKKGNKEKQKDKKMGNQSRPSTRPNTEILNFPEVSLRYPLYIKDLNL